MIRSLGNDNWGIAVLCIWQMNLGFVIFAMLFRQQTLATINKITQYARTTLSRGG